MNFNLKKELPILAVVAMPFIYLYFVWNDLPNKVPTHWNISGEIDNWGNKYSLLVFGFLPIFVYVLFLLIPVIDPKKQIAKMGGKYNTFKFVFVLLMSLLSLFIIYIAKNQSISSPKIIDALLAVLFIVLGNYFKVIQPNYFIGIKTPWTLENSTVWKQTHIVAGKLWVAGGLLILVSVFVIPDTLFNYFFLTIVTVMVLIPVVYSYLEFKKVKKEK